MKRLCDIIDCSYNIEIEGVSSDSRDIKKNYLFVAVNGFNVNHSLFIDDAIKNGAVAVIVDKSVDVSNDIICIKVDDVNKELVSICERFYDVKAEEFKIIGITGTDGKTTSATITKNIISNFLQCAYIGTNGVEIGDEVYSTKNTTPCIEELYYYLNLIKKHGCKHIVMEVSSEALLHKRVDNFKFDIVGFTNITEDHLNIHKTIDNYRRCKFHIVDLLSEEGKVITNGDDVNCKMLDGNNVYTYGSNSDNDYVFSNVKVSKENVKFNIVSDDEVWDIISPYLGKYNLYNMTLAFVICKYLGFDLSEVVRVIKNLSFVRGRREVLKLSSKFDIILDYAHTLNGIKSLLESVTSYNKVIVVTGAAGGREKEKRGLIGTYLLKNCDFVIFTMDDPRYESVNLIIDDMISNSTRTNYKRIEDRKEAIYYAFNYAKEGDVVLVIGKGRDTYMAIDDKKIPYCDYDVILSFFKNEA